jgi:hypothetical protein
MCLPCTRKAGGMHFAQSLRAYWWSFLMLSLAHGKQHLLPLCLKKGMLPCLNTIRFFVAQQLNSDIGLLAVGVSRSHKIWRRHTRTHAHTHTPGRTPLDEWSARCRDRYLHNTQQMNLYALNGIQICDSSNQAAANLCFRPHRRRDRPLIK